MKQILGAFALRMSFLIFNWQKLTGPLSVGTVCGCNLTVSYNLVHLGTANASAVFKLIIRLLPSAVSGSVFLLSLSYGHFYVMGQMLHPSGRWAVLENRILPSLYRSRKHSEKDVSSIVIHCRKFFSHFPHIGFGRITHNASLPDNGSNR